MKVDDGNNAETEAESSWFSWSLESLHNTEVESCVTAGEP